MVFVIIGVFTSRTNQAQIDEDGIRESLMQHLGFLSTPNMEKVSCKCKIPLPLSSIFPKQFLKTFHIRQM